MKRMHHRALRGVPIGKRRGISGPIRRLALASLALCMTQAHAQILPSFPSLPSLPSFASLPSLPSLPTLPAWMQPQSWFASEATEAKPSPIGVTATAAQATKLSKPRTKTQSPARPRRALRWPL